MKENNLLKGEILSGHSVRMQCDSKTRFPVKIYDSKGKLKKIIEPEEMPLPDFDSTKFNNDRYFLLDKTT